MEPRPPAAEPRDGDRVIGVALRRSLAALAVLAGGVGVTWWVIRAPTADEIRTKRITAPIELSSHAVGRPELHFTDVTAEAGIDFVHVNGARGERLLPETMGSGVAFLDFDGDGDPDLLFVNGAAWLWDEGDGAPSTPALYANDGRGRFRDVTAESGLGFELFGMGVAVGDIDDDGDPDLFLTAVGRNRLLRNDGGRFSDITGRAGVAGSSDGWSTGAGFFDADNDGDLDLMVVDYVRWSREIDLEVGFTLNGVDRAYGPPTSFEGTYPALYRNDGGLRFTDVSAQAGLRVDNAATGRPVAKSLGIAIVDLGADGRLDVLVANDTVRNFLFRNQGDGRFREVGEISGVGFDASGKATGAMGVDVADYRNDGALGFAIGNFANEMTSLYVTRGDGWLFADQAIVDGIGSPSRLALSFAVLFLDVDLDGRLDLLQANGHLEETIAQVQSSQRYRQAAQLFWNAGNDGPSTFVAVPAAETGDLARPIVGRGASAADIDGDGDLDVVLTSNGGRPLLLRNDQTTGHHWLRVRLEGAGSNREGIGAMVELEAGGVVQRRRVMPTRSYLSQVESVVTFGLGIVDEVDRLVVVWPDGTRQEVEPKRVDRQLVVEKPATTLDSRKEQR